MKKDKFKGSFCFLGPPASGKRDKAQRLISLVRDLQGDELLHFEAGELFRQISEAGHVVSHDSSREDVREICGNKTERGKLVPNHVSCELVHHSFVWMKHALGVSRYIIDGFPRDVHQAEFAAISAFPVFNHGVAVVELELSREECLRRFLGDNNRAHRNDATVEKMERRIDHYFQNGQHISIRARLQNRVPYVIVDAHGTQEEVFGRVAKALCLC